MASERNREGDAGGEHAGDESTAVVEASGEQPAEPVTEAHGAAAGEGGGPSRQGLGGPVAAELSRAGAEAGDSAAAGTGAEGSPAEAAATGAVGAGGSAAASPERYAGAAAGSRTGEDAGRSGGSGGSGGGGGSGQSLGDRVEAISEQRPEVLVGAAFVGGLILARALAAIGGDG
jgi:hypothetical protein